MGVDADGAREHETHDAHDGAVPEQAPANDPATNDSAADGPNAAGPGTAGRVPPARDPVFAARYLARDGLELGGTPMPVPDGLASMRPGPALGVVLAGLDPQRLHRGQLAEVILAGTRQACHVFAGLLESVWEWACAPVADGGTVVRKPQPHRWAAKELAPLAGWTGYRAQQMLAMARLAVCTAPRLLGTIRAGLLDEARLRIIAEELEPFTDNEDLIRHIIDVLLDGDVGAHTTGTLAEHIRRIIAATNPAELHRSREAKINARKLTHRHGPAGISKIALGFDDAAAMTAAYHHVDAIARATHQAGDPLQRSMDQLRHDIARDLLAGTDPTTAGYTQPGDRRGTINLTLSLATLAGADDEPGHLAGHGPVTAAVARRVAAQFADGCQWRFQLADDHGQLITEGHLPRAAIQQLVASLRTWAAERDRWYGAGDLSRHPVDATAGLDGRSHREPTPAQKAYVRARDRHCQYPGCRIPAHRCDIDHRLAWADDGPTIVANLHCLCKSHHRFKHHAALTYQPGPDGTTWTLPGGRRYLKLRDNTPGARARPGHQRPPTHPGSVIIDVIGYSHHNGPPPRLRH